jgi:hypothetical protein
MLRKQFLPINHTHSHAANEKIKINNKKIDDMKREQKELSLWRASRDNKEKNFFLRL